MTKPIYLLILGKGPREAWFQLTKEEQDTLWSDVQHVDERAGAKWQIVCDSCWADEEIFDWARDRISQHRYVPTEGSRA